ncbi:MAG: PhzF family phenazine biosynthesis protein [Alphaproteobacteria bacterium]|nr:PhzF family phenazine biosynthesis protein [Alphaproteobacteria bacterium]
MTTIPLWQVDAFADRPFSGNPAAVCPLETWLPDATLQAIAAENNLAETAFYVSAPAGADHDFHLRWFTPGVEVDLCGHATLAAGHVLWRHRGFAGAAVRFWSKSGILTVTREGDRYALDFPSRPARPVAPPAGLAEALGAAPRAVLAARDLVCVFDSQAAVAALAPDLAALACIDTFAVTATAPGDEHDYVLRFFAPRAGVPEDPVTGSAQTSLVPYWAGRLGRDTLVGRQISARGGTLWCRLRGDRVDIAGTCADFLAGTITV